jgi:hypothetical protein
MKSRLWNLQLIEELPRHILVVVLAGVDENLLDRVRLAKRVRNDRRLDELRPGADDGQDLDGSTSRWEEQPMFLNTSRVSMAQTLRK